MLKLPIVNKVLEDIGIFFSLDELSLCAICIPAPWNASWGERLCLLLLMICTGQI